MGDFINKKEVIERAEQCIFTDKNQKRQFIDWLEYCLEQPYVEVFPKSYVDQIRWERDIALEQLREIGCELGMKMNEIKQKLESSSDWIPCSERLPEKDGEYLTWIRYDGREFMSIEEFECDGLFATWNFVERNNDKVIAWMPFPEPYKG